MNRRTVAIVLAPLPLVAWYGWRQPVDMLAWALVALLVIASTAGCGLWATQTRLRATEPLAAEVDFRTASSPQDEATPAEVLATVPGVDVTELLARVERLEQHAEWVASGVDDVETYVNLPDPPNEVLSFLERLDGDDRAAG